MPKQKSGGGFKPECPTDTGALRFGKGAYIREGIFHRLEFSLGDSFQRVIYFGLANSEIVPWGLVKFFRVKDKRFVALLAHTVNYRGYFPFKPVAPRYIPYFCGFYNFHFDMETISEAHGKTKLNRRAFQLPGTAEIL
jgi:hypothetical protein